MTGFLDSSVRASGVIRVSETGLGGQQRRYLVLESRFSDS